MKKALILSLLLLPLLTTAQSSHIPQAVGTMRVMTYNVRNGIGMDRVTDYDRVATVIRTQTPKLVALQELDSITTRSKGVDVLQELAKLTGMHAVYAPALHDFGGGKYGIGALSVEKPVSARYLPLPGAEEVRVLQIVEFADYVLFNTHFSLTEEDRLHSADIIMGEVKKYTAKPILLAGDFNDHPSSELIKNLQLAGWTLLSNPNHPTFPSDMPTETIDYLFYYSQNPVMEGIAKQSVVVDEPMASDHRPVIVDFVITK